jgi:pilus assembly protein FimV
LGATSEQNDPAADLDFDLGEADNPAADLDFDLGEADNPAADLDFDLGEADNLAADLDFDLGEADNPAANLDFGLADSTAAAVEDSELDFDLDFDGGSFDGDAEVAPEAAAELDLDFGADTEPQVTEAEALVLDEAIATDDDFNFDFATSASPDTSDDLDDLWGDDRATTDSTPEAWAAEADLDDMAIVNDDLNLETDDLSATDLDLDTLNANPGEANLEDTGLGNIEFGDEGFETAAFDLEEIGSVAELEMTDSTGENFDFAAETVTPDSDAFLNLEPDFELETAEPEGYLDPGLEDIPPELLAPEDIVFEDLGAVADLDLTEPAIADGWPAEPDLALGAEADLESYSSSETDLELTNPDSFAEISATPWEESDGDFDPNLAFAADAAEQNLAGEPGFDPGLTFAPETDTDYIPPNPFEAEAFPLEEDIASSGFDTDLPFSTMELDSTVEGGPMPSDNLALDSGFGTPDDFGPDDFGPDDFGDITLEQPDLYGATDNDMASVGLVDDGAEDLAFESVEFAADDLNVPGFEAGFSDGGFDDQRFDNPDFGDAGFDEDEFDAEGLGDRPASANGFMPNGAALTDDEPDATDDFIQEFGSDPSSHVSLTPDQFNEDGSMRRSGGSGLPMKLILGLGALALVLAGGLLLNGLLGRLRQPSPGGDPVVTEPAAPAPEDTPEAAPLVDPAAVEEADLFRQAVNAAQTAANQAQTANSAAEWQAVADAWANSIALMQRVPETDPNYAVAQQKAVEYQPNLAYAQQNVQRF